MFFKAIASSEYADIVTTLQSNVDSYRHDNDEYFLPQHFWVTSIAMSIHNNTKARVQDLGHPRVNRVRGWDNRADVLSDDELQFGHLQGYEPRVLRIEQGRGGRGPHRRGLDRRQAFDHRQDRSSLAGDRSSLSSTPSSASGSTAPRSRFARPDQRRRSFLPTVQCEACKRIGHEAVNCDMLALALFIERHKHLFQMPNVIQSSLNG